MSLFQSVLADLKKGFDEKNVHNEAIAVLCSKVLHTTITASQVKIVKGKLSLTVSSTIRMTMKLKQPELLSKIQAVYPEIQSIN